MLKNIVLEAIKVYQMMLSPYIGGCCRHEPTCSRYAHEAISRHGVGTGIQMAASRLLRCTPLGTSGYDPVP